jgi:hypothetical protein
MTEFLFPDNTVLCDFAAVDRMDLLRSVLDGRGRWTEAVAHEAHKSAAYLPTLATLARRGWLGEPIEVTEEVHVRQIEHLRRAVFGGGDDRPLQHLGEAQSCYVILNWAEFAGSWWITNDRDAVRYARFQGITTRETIDLMSIAVVDGDITALDAFALMTRMTDAGRHLRLPKSPGEFAR